MNLRIEVRVNERGESVRGDVVVHQLRLCGGSALFDASVQRVVVIPGEECCCFYVCVSIM
jgi:hypothetical protein